MRRFKRVVAIALCAAMAASTVVTKPVSVDAAAKIKLSKTKVTLDKGKKLTLTLKKGKKKITKKITWSTTNKKVVTVTKAGKITAKKKGTATIKVKYNKKTYSCKVTVTDKKGDAAAAAAKKKAAEDAAKQAEEDAAKKVAAENQAAADKVIAAINAIGTVTVDSEKAINDAKTAYNALTEDQKKLVTNYATLTAAETALVAAKNQAAAKTVIDAINSLGTITEQSEAAIQAARKAYDALTEDQKKLVTNLSTLTDSETELVRQKGFIFERDVTIEYGFKDKYIEFTLKKDEKTGEYDPDEIADLRDQGCTVDEESGTVTKNQRCETAKYTFKKLPSTLDDIKQFFANPEKNDTSDIRVAGADPNYGGFNAMAATICAACTFTGGANPSDPFLSNDPVRQMFEYINGPAESMNIYKGDMDNSILSMKEALKISPNIYKSYFNGSSPANNYTPSEPYVLEMYKGPYFIDEKWTITGKRPTTYMILVKSSGSDAERYIDVYYSTKEKRWFSYQTQFRHIIANDFKPVEEEL